jgi:hypothetical protein
VQVRAWPYAVGRGYEYGYRTLLAPDFLSTGDHYLLEYASSGEATQDGVAVARAVLGVGGTPLTLVYRVVRPTADRYGLPGVDLLTDSAGRPITVFEGFVIRLPVGEAEFFGLVAEDFESLRRLIAPVYRDRWREPQGRAAESIATVSGASAPSGTPVLGDDSGADSDSGVDATVDPSAAPRSPAMTIRIIEPFVVPKREVQSARPALAPSPSLPAMARAAQGGASRDRVGRAYPMVQTDDRPDRPGAGRASFAVAVFVATAVLLAVGAVLGRISSPSKNVPDRPRVSPSTMYSSSPTTSRPTASPIPTAGVSSVSPPPSASASVGPRAPGTRPSVTAGIHPTSSVH